MAQQELIARVLEFTDEHRREFVEETGWRPLKSAVVRAVKKLQGHYGDSGAGSVDDVVYGERH